MDIRPPSNSERKQRIVVDKIRRTGLRLRSQNPESRAKLGKRILTRRSTTRDGLSLTGELCVTGCWLRAGARGPSPSAALRASASGSGVYPEYSKGSG